MDTENNAGKFKNKYRIASARWAAWDYSSNAAYFVTLCVANRAHDFGRIVDGKMILSPLGQSAQDCWDEIPAHFPFVELGERMVMPNHIHGVLTLIKPDGATVPVETQHIASLPRNRFGPQSQNLASIIRGYKIGVTKFARQNGIPFEWQARYHDRVIRNAEEHYRIQQYILSNPQNWEEDDFYAVQSK